MQIKIVSDWENVNQNGSVSFQTVYSSSDDIIHLFTLHHSTDWILNCML